MNFVLLFLALVFLCLTIYLWNWCKVTKTIDLKKLFLELIDTDPTAVGYCLGYDEKNKTYANVYFEDEELNPIVRNESNPIDIRGAFMLQTGHGQLTELDNGYRISGLDSFDFSCPPGFEGPNCQLIPLCGDSDSGLLKPLTYTQFNALGLYLNNKPTSSVTRAETTHPRLRILCLDNHDYEIQRCAPNQLLNDNLQCVAYDICSDQLSGYKHNFPISEHGLDLNPNEYYICNAGVSEKTTCSQGTVFSADNRGCVTNSECYGKGTRTIRIDDRSYIQCSKDLGTIVQCSTHAVGPEDQLKCFVSLCTPETFQTTYKMLTYDTGEVRCVANQPNYTNCSDELENRSWSFSWAESFSFDIDYWPKEIYKNQVCQSPTDDIISNPIVQFRWSAAMSEDHPFNILEKRFVCDPDTSTHFWDYFNGQIVPSLTAGQIADPSSPCVTQLYTISDFEGIFNFPNPIQIPNTGIPIMVGVPIEWSSRLVIGTWPKVVSSATVEYQTFHYDIPNRALVIRKYSSSSFPAGFLDNDVSSAPSTPVNIAGVPTSALPSNKESIQWYSIHTGNLRMFRSEPTVQPTETTILCSTSVPVTVDSETPIFWLSSDLNQPMTAFVEGNFRLEITRNSVRLYESNVLKAEEPAIFAPVKVEVTGAQSLIKYRGISITVLDNAKASRITLP